MAALAPRPGHRIAIVTPRRASCSLVVGLAHAGALLVCRTTPASSSLAFLSSCCVFALRLASPSASLRPPPRRAPPRRTRRPRRCCSPRRVGRAPAGHPLPGMSGCDRDDDAADTNAAAPVHVGTGFSGPVRRAPPRHVRCPVESHPMWTRSPSLVRRQQGRSCGGSTAASAPESTKPGGSSRTRPVPPAEGGRGLGDVLELRAAGVVQDVDEHSVVDLHDIEQAHTTGKAFPAELVGRPQGQLVSAAEVAQEPGLAVLVRRRSPLPEGTDHGRDRRSARRREVDSGRPAGVSTGGFPRAASRTRRARFLRRGRCAPGLWRCNPRAAGRSNQAGSGDTISPADTSRRTNA